MGLNYSSRLATENVVVTHVLTSILTSNCTTEVAQMNWLKNKLPNISKPAKAKLWWAAQWASIAIYTDAFVSLDNPDLMPYAGAFASLFFYWFFTRVKQKYDDATKQCQIAIIDTMLNYDITTHETSKNEIADIKHRVDEAKYEIKKLRSDLTQKAKITTADNGMVISHLPSAFSARLGGRPMPPNFRGPSIVIDAEGYRDRINELRTYIKDNDEFSGRLSKMEGFGIFYGAFLTVFGADIMRWLST